MIRARHPQERALRDLARLYGVQHTYIDVARRRRQASPEALLLVLRALGAPVASLRDVPAAVRRRRQALWERGLEPVTVAWEGRPSRVELRLPVRQATRRVHCHLTLESGVVKSWVTDLARPRTGRPVTVEGERFAAVRLALPRPLPQGYHRLRVETSGRTFESLVISAPVRAYDGGGDTREGEWGVFLPLYALQSGRSWGAGDFTDLELLAEWLSGLGGRIVATLPVLAAFLDEPFDPSPYAPASRLFWNEVYVDVTRVPELDTSSAARALLASGEVQRELQKLQAAPLVDYRRLMALKRRILEALADALSGAVPGRLAAFRRFLDGRPEVEDYARFRATGERRNRPWPSWPSPLADGVLTAADSDGRAQRYHRYVQWVADEQIQNVSAKMEGAGLRLYLDLPLGVHPYSYDVWRNRESFAREISAGAPPDVVFTAGQDWGFPPLHPEAIRAQGYQYVLAYLRHQLAYAGLLRIDHVMGLHRLFWIPNGLEPRHGVYVDYPAEELYAILCLESHRHRTRLVGENLGTVPPVVNKTMAAHHFLQMYVVEYELGGSPRQVLRPVPRNAVASVSTHDMPPFAAYWEGLDIDDRRQLGLLSASGARTERKTRGALQQALVRFLRRRGWLTVEAPDLTALLAACLRYLSASPARSVLVNLEDLWLEREPQNVPTTGVERPNWRRKARHRLEAFRATATVRELLAEVDRSRRRARH